MSYSLPSLARIKELVAREKDLERRAWSDALRKEGIASSKYHLLPRGTYVAVEIRKGGRVENYYPGQCYEWNGTLGDIRNAIDSATKDGSELMNWSLFGGFDGVEDVRNVFEARRERDTGNYDPEVVQWAIEFFPNGVYKDPELEV